MKKWFYDIVRPILTAYYHVLYHVRGVNSENLPKEGGAILCSNHISANDPLVIATCTRRYLRFMAKAELFKNKLLAQVITAIGAFPVRRGERDLGAIRTAMQVLNNGEVLGIFPQGTRSRENAHTHMESGVALIALRSGMPVVPVYITSRYRLFKKTEIIFGKPVTLEEFGRKIDAETLQAATAKIENAIWALASEK